jgi:uncharacterized protein YndB with AHSA1/START domain
MSETKTLTVASVGEREIVITRALAAPPRLVFKAWTTPELLRQWLGPRTWEMVECEIDLREGGAWRYLMRGPDGVEMGIHGAYREVMAPVRLVTTESYDDNWTGGETLVTTVFSERRGGTVVTTTVRYASAEARDAVLASGMERGIAEGYDRLDEVLATMKGKS